MLPSLRPVPQVVLRPGETLRIHTYAETGAATLSVDGGPETTDLSWTASRPGRVALIARARTDSSALDHPMRVVVAPDIRSPAFRLNVRWRERTVEVTLVRRTRLAACFTRPGLLSGPGPVVPGWRSPGVVRIPFAGRFPRSVTLRADTPSGVTRVVTVTPPTE